MTEQEAMEVLKQPCLCDYDLSKTVFDCDIKQCDKRDAVLQAIKALEEICQYREIGAPEECRAAVEKQKVKKPEPIDYKKYMNSVKNAKFLRGAYWCPNCNHVVRSGSCCDDCGQKLDWSDEQRKITAIKNVFFKTTL